MFFDYNGTKMYYDVQGSGEPVLLLHGWGGSTESYLPVTDALKLKRKVITVDFPGHGKSDAPPFPWSVTEYAELTHAFIEHLNIAPTDAVAHSFGGRVLIYIASHYKSDVKKIVLVDSAGIMPKRGLKYKLKVYRHKLAKRLARIGFIDRAFRISERAKNAGSADYRALSDDMKKTFVRVVNQDLQPFLKDVDAETLLVWGSLDTATPLSDGKLMEREIKNSGLVVFEGAGHFSYLDEYPRFMAVLNCFLEGIA